MEAKLMKVTEVAEVINASIPRTYELLRMKIIPSVRMGRQVRVDREVLLNWIRSGGQANAESPDEEIINVRFNKKTSTTKY